MQIGIAGLGTIGSKLVEYLSEKGFEVVAYNWRNIEEKHMQFEKTLEKKVQYNKVSYENMELIKNRVTFTDKIENLRASHILIESLREDYNIKTSFYSRVKDVLQSNYILATTTSCLSLERLSLDVNRSRFLGLHFFNPPTKMRLIELSFVNDECEVKEQIYHFLSMLDDKKVIEIPPIQGYIVNTILLANINFSIEFQNDSGIPFKDIDEAMKLGTNCPMGPFELSDYIGNDVTLQILDELFSSLGKNIYKPTNTLKEMVRENKLGRKTGEGFYKYGNL
jgi:3-hydroxybutyryl-CoA dehydrogenase